LEQLCAQRIVSCWLQLQYADPLYVQNLKLLNKLHKRYLFAIHSLAQVSKLLKPSVAQINIADKQINKADLPRVKS
jgi:hypothetical protein